MKKNYYVFVPSNEGNLSTIYEFKNYSAAYRFRKKYKFLNAVLIKYKNNHDLFAIFVPMLGNANKENNRKGLNDEQ